MTLPVARSLRNNNPGNIRAGEPWQGLMPESQMDGPQLAEREFCVFQSPKWGFRALAVLLLNYQVRHVLRSIDQIINRWAPPSENDTAAYVKAVSESVGIAADAELELHDAGMLSKLCKAIAMHEAGGWVWQDQDLAEGLALALAGSVIA